MPTGATQPDSGSWLLCRCHRANPARHSGPAVRRELVQDRVNSARISLPLARLRSDERTALLLRQGDLTRNGNKSRQFDAEHQQYIVRIGGESVKQSERMRTSMPSPLRLMNVKPVGGFGGAAVLSSGRRDVNQTVPVHRLAQCGTPLRNSGATVFFHAAVAARFGLHPTEVLSILDRTGRLRVAMVSRWSDESMIDEAPSNTGYADERSRDRMIGFGVVVGWVRALRCFPPRHPATAEAEPQFIPHSPCIKALLAAVRIGFDRSDCAQVVTRPTGVVGGRVFEC